MMVNRRRSDFEIIGDMLRAGRNGAGKTKIMYTANMSYTQMQKYLSFLMGHGFIIEVKVGNPAGTYQVTESGLKLLKSINNSTRMLGLYNVDKLNSSRAVSVKVT